jgi:CheY-like chemotaxis protein
VHGLTILVVDDDEFVLDATRLLLEDLGARVLTASDGARALDQIEAEPPDLILTALTMPKLDGYELVERLRHDPLRAGLPIIAVSFRVTPADRDKTQQAGFDAHVGKPLDYGDLREGVGIVMRHQPLLYARQRDHLRRVATQERLKARELRQQAKLAMDTQRRPLATDSSCPCGASTKTLWQCADCARPCCAACAFRLDGALYCMTCADRLAA